PAHLAEVGHHVDAQALDRCAPPVDEGLMGARGLDQRQHALALLLIQPPAAGRAHPRAVIGGGPAGSEWRREHALAGAAAAKTAGAVKTHSLTVSTAVRARQSCCRYERRNGQTGPAH